MGFEVIMGPYRVRMIPVVDPCMPRWLRGRKDPRARAPGQVQRDLPAGPEVVCPAVDEPALEVVGVDEIELLLLEHVVGEVALYEFLVAVPDEAVGVVPGSQSYTNWFRSP